MSTLPNIQYAPKKQSSIVVNLVMMTWLWYMYGVAQITQSGLKPTVFENLQCYYGCITIVLQRFKVISKYRLLLLSFCFKLSMLTWIYCQYMYFKSSRPIECLNVFNLSTYF